ncbi:MAG: Unknown protein [uncultured Aureispira sp.]|uniref:Uncharacterized protein n=1 Tax=uncultured Aureispira sp. TaxID=1331704 RepID=A0A6S6UD71_9BACT|nr:MAG: Unknown protein [uncultured Aureispira sp.]
MKTLQHVLLLFVLGICSTAFGQNKTDIPSTYSEVCYFTIKKVAFDDFLAMKKAIAQEAYGPVYAAIRKMRSNLKGFVPSSQNRAFELWYAGNYTDFDEQSIVAKGATLAALKNYETHLRTGEVLYYNHRLFLDQYLAFVTEAFYPEYWFMSQERYFSRDLVDLMRKLNPKEGYKLFANSEFFFPFDVFNEMANTENEEIGAYLEDGLDTSSFIPYSYMRLGKGTASYVLASFDLDDATQEIDLNREVRALKKFLTGVKNDEIYFVARFNHLEIRRMKAIEALKKGGK